MKELICRQNRGLGHRRNEQPKLCAITTDGLPSGASTALQNGKVNFCNAARNLPRTALTMASLSQCPYLRICMTQAM